MKLKMRFLVWARKSGCELKILSGTIFSSTHNILKKQQNLRGRTIRAV